MAVSLDPTPSLQPSDDRLDCRIRIHVILTHMNDSGSADRFPQTRHSVLTLVRSDNRQERRRALDLLVAAYWRPIYKYLRIRHRADADDAADLTQGFFCELLEKETLANFDSAKARFRTFVRVCLDRYVGHQREAAGRQKRGGDALHVSLDFRGAESEVTLLHGAVPPDIDRFFEQEWVRSLLALALQSFRQRCREDNKEVHLALFEAYDLAALESDDRPTYASLADRFHITEITVTNYLAWARRTFRAELLVTVRAITANEEEYRAELRAVLGVEPS